MSERYVLIVKGQQGQVQSALNRRRVGFVRINPITTANTCTVLTTKDVLDADPAMLAKWLCESEQPTPGIGYPAGSLLWYGPYQGEKVEGA